jgi:hypothetical protein
MKLFKATLNVFYDAVGGMGNVTKIELDEEKNRLQWNGTAFDEKNILEMLHLLLTKA